MLVLIFTKPGIDLTIIRTIKVKMGIKSSIVLPLDIKNKKTPTTLITASNSKNILTEYQKEIDNLSLQLTDIKEKDLEISVLEDTIKKLEKDINTSQQTITNNIKEISELEKDILEININNKEKDLEISILEDSIELLENEVTNYQNIVSSNQDTDTMIKEQLETISQLQNNLIKLENGPSTSPSTSNV